MSRKKSNGIIGLDSTGRARYWTFLVYEDSAPENWRSILDDYHAPWVESPYHDKDINPDGTPKKPHWHVMIYFEGKRSFDQIVDLVNLINSPIPQPVLSAQGLIRYFIHLDNPEKFQYNMLDIVPHQGIDITKYFFPSETQHIAYLHQMFDFINQQDIRYYSDLLDYARLHKPDTWFVTLSQRYGVMFSKYFISKEKKRSDGF
jgi:hypothetical protein